MAQREEIQNKTKLCTQYPLCDYNLDPLGWPFGHHTDGRRLLELRLEQLVSNELNNILIETNFPVEKNSTLFQTLFTSNAVATSLLDCCIDSPC